MPDYRRSRLAGGTYFFTVALADRSATLLTDHIEKLRRSYRAAAAKMPFETVAICILPDHLHAIWTLPEGDADYAKRWNLLKGSFSRTLPPNPARSSSKAAKREKGIWQRRYWEHQIRDEKDLEAHVKYIYFNPVKHGLVERIADWPHSSFHRDVQRGIWTPDAFGVISATNPSSGATFGE